MSSELFFWRHSLMEMQAREWIAAFSALTGLVVAIFTIVNIVKQGEERERRRSYERKENRVAKSPARKEAKQSTASREDLDLGAVIGGLITAAPRIVIEALEAEKAKDE